MVTAFFFGLSRFSLWIKPLPKVIDKKKKVLSSLFNETVIFKTQKAGFIFEDSKGSLAKMFWRILFLAFLIGEYDQAVW